MSRGHLRIYLGAAPGVGKTYAMLNEGNRRRERGSDVVIGVVETHGRINTAEQLRTLEVIPLRNVEYRDTLVPEMDLDAIIARKPGLVLVDELAHTNAPGSRNEKRWQDVDELIDAGIDVISTVNVQHLESLNDVVERITGVKQRETIPDKVVRAADQIELVDMSPEALRKRLAHGNVYPANRVDAALANYFRPENLGALRELALLWVADRVEDSLTDYLDAHGITETWETRERVVVAITAAPSSDALIRRAARIAGRRKGELHGVHVSNSSGRAATNNEADDGMQERRQLLIEVSGSFHEIVSEETAQAIVEFATSRHATQLVIGESSRSRWNHLFGGSLVRQIIARSNGIDVHVIAIESNTKVPKTRARPPLSRSSIPRSRVRIAWLVAAVGLPLITLLLLLPVNPVGLPIVLLSFLGLVLIVGAIGGRTVSLIAAVLAALIENWFFVVPTGTFSVGETEDGVAIAMFLLVGGTVGTLVERVAQRANDASRARVEAEALARAAATLVSEPNPLPALLGHLLNALKFTGASVLRRDHSGWEVVASAGSPVPSQPGDGDSIQLGSNTNMVTDTDALDHLLVVAGGKPTAEDWRILRVFGAQLQVGLDSTRRSTEAETARVLGEVDVIRTALLRAVSHDLRSPLAATKAYVSGLLSPDVAWSPEQTRVSLVGIEEETDRLNHLVGNLLDASRLQAGSLGVTLRATSIADVVALAQRVGPGRVEVIVPAGLPTVIADGALLERSIENVLSNAIRFQPAEAKVRIDASVVGKYVHLRVIDCGPGIDLDARKQALSPFQRLGDHNTTDGVGLGLSIAQGFVHSMHGEFALDTTPGGGLTVTMKLPISTEPN